MSNVPRRTCKSRWETRAGRTGRPIQLSPPPLTPPFPLSPPSRRHHLGSHPSFSSPNPSAPPAVSALDEDAEPCLHLALEHLLPPAGPSLRRAWIVMGVMCQPGQKKKTASSFPYSLQTPTGNSLHKTSAGAINSPGQERRIKTCISRDLSAS